MSSSSAKTAKKQKWVPKQVENSYVIVDPDAIANPDAKRKPSAKQRVKNPKAKQHAVAPIRQQAQARQLVTFQPQGFAPTKQEAKEPSKNNEALVLRKGKLGKIVVYVKDSFLHAIALVGGTLVRIKISLSNGYVASRARIVNLLLPITSGVEKFRDMAISSAIAAAQSVPVPMTIKENFVFVKGKAGGVLICVKDSYIQSQAALKVSIMDQYTGIRSMIANAATSAKTSTVSAYLAAVDNTKAIAAERPIATSAASGAILLGTGGGAAGLAAGGVTGAACGLPFALFTFGLSIPFGAAIGGGAGACVGATAGGAAGAVGGGVARYGYEHRAQIKAASRIGKACKFEKY